MPWRGRARGPPFDGERCPRGAARHRLPRLAAQRTSPRSRRSSRPRRSRRRSRSATCSCSRRGGHACSPSRCTGRSRSCRRASPPVWRPRGRLPLEKRRSARTHDRAAPASRPLAREAPLDLEPVAFSGRAVTLYESRLHPRGARYEALVTALLRVPEGHMRRFILKGAARPCGARGPPERVPGRPAVAVTVDHEEASAARASTCPSTARTRCRGRSRSGSRGVGKTSGKTMCHLSGGRAAPAVSEMLSVVGSALRPSSRTSS